MKNPSLTGIQTHTKLAQGKNRSTRKQASRNSIEESASQSKEASDGAAQSKGAPVAVWALFIAVVIMTISGVGTIAITSILGLVLCGIGLSQNTTRVDWWILAPLIVYVGMNLVSSYAYFGNIVHGYGPVQVIFLSVYALSCCLDSNAVRRLRELCVLWAGLTATLGIIGFAASSFFVSVTRLEFVVGAPNALGIFLVLGWFALFTCRQDEESNGPLMRILPYFEPIILVAMTLTLSMGAFLALLVGIIVFIAGQLRKQPCRDVLSKSFVLLSKAVVCLAVGLLMYMSAERSEMPILCAAFALYVGAMSLLWLRFDEFLQRRRAISKVLTIVGLLCVPLAIIMRPSSFATFAERIHMMGNGISYLDDSPLIGVGPGQWRELNLLDSDMYFNTNHIHNLFIHAGVEFGIVAMIALIVIAVRCFIKRYEHAQHGEDAAFLTHVMIDTGFFFLGVTSLFMLTANGSTTTVKALPKLGSKVLFALLALMHLAILVTYISVY